jgi:predicted ribosome quality control (RQC) complex YloA/Tae2 family protein
VDAWLLAAVRAELEATCSGGRVDRIGQPQPTDVALEIRTRQGTRHVLLSVDPAMNRVHLLSRRLPSPPQPPPFCQLLRRHLEGARWLGCSQPGLERLLELRLEARDDLGNLRLLRLVAELTGRLANLVLIGPDGRVLDALRRVSAEVNRVRQLQPGLPYVPPPRPQARLDPVLALQQDPTAPWREELAQALEASAPGTPAAQRLAATVFGLTPPLAEALAAWALGAPDGPPAAPAAEPWPPEVRALVAAVDGLARSVLEGRFRPCVLETPRGPVASAWPLPGCPAQPCATVQQACERAYGEAVARQRLQATRQRLGAALRAARARVGRRIARQEEEWARVEAADALRTAGELLLAYGHLVPRGAREALLPAFEDPERQVAIALDPALSAAANAQRLLRAYRKAQRARDEVAARLAASREEADALAETAVALAHADDPAALAAVEAEMVAQGLLRPPAARGRPRAGRAAAAAHTPPPAPPLRFSAGDGWVILVGRSARGNDQLTMRLARPDDLWLHARQIPGSHVLLQPAPGGPMRGEPPAQAVAAAARCAAHFSAARGGSAVPVDLTARRHVWKPAGARPGFVRYRHERTLVVDATDAAPLPPPLPESVPAAGEGQAPRPGDGEGPAAP